MRAFSKAILIPIAALCCGSGLAETKAPTAVNDKTLNGFTQNQFVDAGQADRVGAHLSLLLGRIAIGKPDGTLQVTLCRSIEGAPNITTSMDNSKQPVFEAVVDKTWGLNIAATVLNITTSGEDKADVTASRIMEAALSDTNVPDVDKVTKDSAACVSSNDQAWYIASATLFSVVKHNYTKAEASGILAFLKINGATYSETGTTNTNAVAIFAYPMPKNAAGKFVVTNKSLAAGGRASALTTLGVRPGNATGFRPIAPRPATIDQRLLNEIQAVRN